MLTELCLALVTPVFVFFPKIAQLYEFSIIFLDVSESTALFVLVTVTVLTLIGTLELVLRGYRKLRATFPKSKIFSFGDAVVSAALKKLGLVKRLSAALKLLLKRTNLK